MKPIETIWFENISVFSEPILSLGPIRASMKQLLYTLLALALALSIFNFLKQPILAIPFAGILLLFAYAKPYGQNFEVLLIDMVSFFRKKKIGITEEKKKEDKKKGKDKDKDKEKETIVVEAATPTTITATESTTTTTVPTITTESIPTIIDIEDTTTKTKTESIVVSSKSNLLHYVVPKHKDFDLEVTDNELVVVTGNSTIHIPSSSSKVKLLIEIDNREIVRIVVNEQG